MPTARASIIAGPARITFKGHVIFSKDDIKVTTNIGTFDVQTSGRRVQKREDNVTTDLSFTPNGVLAPICPLIMEYATMRIGVDIFGDADSPIVIESQDGKTYTYAAGALSKIPDLNLSAGKTPFGAMTLMALGANNTAPTAANRRLTIAATGGGYPADDGYDPDAIFTEAWPITWGDAPWADMETEDGATVSFNLSTAPKKTDGGGIIGMRFTGLDVTAKAKPIGPTSADVLAALAIQGDGAGRGRKLTASGKPWVATAGGYIVTLNAASLTAGGDTFSGTNNRVDELTWMAHETVVEGSLVPAFYVGLD